MNKSDYIFQHLRARCNKKFTGIYLHNNIFKQDYIQRKILKLKLYCNTHISMGFEIFY